MDADEIGREIAGRYAAMSEVELRSIAAAYDSLTDEAQSAIRAEFAHRGLEAPLVDEVPEQRLGTRELVTVRRYRDLSEAIVARTLLESAGIFVLLREENMVRLEWQISNFLGGIRLQVPSEDAASANELLDQPVPELISGEGMEFEQPRCPVCASVDMSYDGNNRKAALASLYLFSLPLPLGDATWECRNCGARWVDEDAAPAGP